MDNVFPPRDQNQLLPDWKNQRVPQLSENGVFNFCSGRVNNCNELLTAIFFPKCEFLLILSAILS